MIQRLPTIGVMGSHQNANEAFAAPLGKWIAENGFNLLTGGGTGSMETVSRAFAEVAGRKGRCIGVIPTIQTENGIVAAKPGYPNPFVEISIVTPLGVFTGEDPNQVTRNYVNVMSSDVLVYLAGGRGTLNEYHLGQKFGKPGICFGSAEDLAMFPPEAYRTDNLHDLDGLIRVALV